MPLLFIAGWFVYAGLFIWVVSGGNNEHWGFIAQIALGVLGFFGLGYCINYFKK